MPYSDPMKKKAWRRKNVDSVRLARVKSRKKLTEESGIIVNEYIRGAVAQARKRAIKRGVPFLVTINYVKALWDQQAGVCAISGLAFEKALRPGVPGIRSPSIDRIRPELGYVEGNLRFILHGLNAMKGQNSDIDVHLVCQAVMERLS